ncbi:MupA/Atu3671 family FMN-dependent luciferase-like monooxygenase [Phaeobacter gallaeciensis]|uniref:Natural product biosynthesis luciferase-like monooxygenase domain protein n=1 Tax=Phaeobacter gallaeciensis TaxID=60890 RepID=A0AAD0EDW8_9RHOB|nr:MupA/Atu3671 family FMN-dependent luciferase-like monooxygenase [Phaeobacter gallaeciensis]AHD10702.1 natural product biosynthesis luciferase-like monooxygenase domain protein [Phaeobacter gallaeciensis DSM 26640]ATE93965.1 natural product biosynthesis luciferase-like monooxygenase domain protein [Phaeobacter gallaeciensis]ATE96214.1 natural product biosynthesis luciferase-like monooxygenase domain protein [Phaeobacter gallaeciensis]ATF02629.1 natural product biosynthesis luciferase-like mon
MTPFSCIVLGNESLLVACADMLLARGHSIAAVVTKDAEIRQWAADKGLTVLEDARDFDGSVDWLLSIANLEIIPDSVLARASKGGVNFHDGPLPRYAGLNTPNWALIEGAEDYGITWHMIEGGVDEGDILAQRLFAIAEDETAYSLNAKCYAAAMDSFGDVLGQLETGTLVRTAQDFSTRKLYTRADRPEADALLDLAQPAADLHRLVRALDFNGYWNPLCAAKVRLPATSDAPVALIGTAEIAEGSGAPGTVLSVDDTTMTLACGDGALRIGGLHHCDGRPIRAADHVKTGDSLPSLDAAASSDLTRQLAATQASEGKWRKALAALPAVDLPLAGPAADGAVEINHLTLSHNAPLTEVDVLSVALALTLSSSGAEAAGIALSTDALQETAIAGLICDWVPLQARRDEPLDDLRPRLATDLDSTRNNGGFAADLIARAPELRQTGGSGLCPDIGCMLGRAQPIDGCAATLSLSEGALALHIDTGRVDVQATELLVGRAELLIDALDSASGGTIADLPILPEAERRQMLVDWNSTARSDIGQSTIPAEFAAQVTRTPEATALVYEDQSLTYAELSARVDHLAALLRDRGVEPGSHVGIYLGRGPDLVIAALATMAAGGAYVPLDPAYPADRIAHFIADSAASVILTDTGHRDQLPGKLSADILCLDALPEVSAVAGTVAETPTNAPGPEDLAYLIYTSGSTGTPKGVMVRHGNVTNFFAAMDDRIPHQPGDCWLAVTSLSFDISVLELFWTLSRGFKLVLSSDEARLQLSNGPVATSDRGMDFNLFYWGNDDGPGPRKYELLLEGAKFADQHGFNAVWTPERHFHAFGGPYPNPAVTGAAVAAVTKNIGVRAGSCVAPLHHPARIAEEWSVIDNLTGGRAGIGFASGWQPDDFILRPENTPPANKPALFESIETVRKLWRGEEVAFPRKDGGEHAVLTQPRPVSKELPVWVTTAGNPETWREAGSIGANVLTHLLGQSIEEVAGKITIYHDALRAAGHDPSDHKVTLMLHSYLAGTREDARATAREPMKDYLRAAAGLIKQYAWAFPAFKKPEGVKNPFEMDLGMLSEEELEAILDFAFERYFEDSGLFGTIADALQRVEQLKQIGVDEIACLIDYGIAPEIVLEGLKPLAEVLRLANAPQELSAEDVSLAAQILRHGVTHMQCTPPMARMITADADARPVLGRLSHLLIGGEALPGDLVASLRATTRAEIHNMYGPTETTIWSTMQSLAEVPVGTAQIGAPIANTTVYVVNDSLIPQPIGVPGELLIGGAGVTAGYWQRPDLTAERFIPDPFADAGAHVASTHLYRTGDLVRWRADGQLEFLGRSDHQVKIRGQRIELGEIEAALAAMDGITGAVVIARETAGDTRLIAYVTGPVAPDQAALKAALMQRLAAVMVPSHIEHLDAFPLTPNKKIDRKALPDPKPVQISVPTSDAPLSTGAQSKIAEIWSGILGVSGIGAEDNFFTLGGHSLLAVQAHRDIRGALDVPKLSITDIFRFPTLSGLAGHIDALTGASPVEDAPAAPAVDAAAKSDMMSKRRAMRANRKARSG